jgi:uncharacterized membrane protein
MSQPDFNPYASPSADAATPVDAASALTLPAIVMLVSATIGLVGTIMNLIVWGLAFAGRGPLAESAGHDVPLAPQMLAVCAWMLVQSILMVLGSISMMRRRSRWLALAGAWAGILPMCGCYVLSLVAGIWALVVLRRPAVKAVFAS